MDVSYDAATGIVRIVVTGPRPTEETHRKLAQRLTHMRVPSGAAALVDVRAVQPGTEPHYQDVVGNRERLGEIGRRAYLVREGNQYGVARMIQATAPQDVDMQVFTDEAAAIDWLRHRPTY